MAGTSKLMAPFFAKLHNTPFNIAPERAPELAAAIFDQARWRLVFVNGAPPGGIQQFSSNPQTKEVAVSSSGLAMVWCVALYAAFTIDLVKSAQGKREGAVDVGPLFAKFAPYLEYAKSLRQQDRCWPANLVAPNLDSAEQALQETNNIFFGAISWILLHEIAHIHKSHEALLPPDLSIRQEEDADQFATRWIFDHVSDQMHREFRILCVGIALAWLLLFEPIGGDAKHPPAHTRLFHVTKFFQGEKMSIALEVVAHLFKILFFPDEIPPAFKTSQELLDWTLMQLRRLAK